MASKQPFNQALYDTDDQLAAASAWLTCNGFALDDARYITRQMFAAAERATPADGAVSDEALLDIYLDAHKPAWKEAYQRSPDDFEEANRAGRLAGIRAVRAALGPPLPVVPEGWTVEYITVSEHGVWSAHLLSGDTRKALTGTGHTPNAALTGAIAATKEADQ